MKPRRTISRRSFLATVSGTAVAGSGLLAIGSDAGAMQVTDRDPTDPIGRGRGTGSGITDNDPSDPIGRGRGGIRDPGTGITDRDPTDPIGRGRGGSRGTTGITDSDPTDPIGNGRGGGAPRSGCSDSDPTDPGGNGRNCRTGGSGSDIYPTGRRERRYDVCWVDHPSRTNDECNMQIYSEWQIVYSDGHLEYDASESQARQAEMTARGYTARWHRMIVNDWLPDPRIGGGGGR